MAKSRICKICVLCRKDIDDELKYGKLYKSKNVWVHYYCLLLSETITQSGEDEEGILGFMPQDITKELERSKSKKCCYCNEMMATLGCVHKHCNRKFHLYCGYINNAMFHFTKFTVHCNLHTKPSNLPAYIKKSLKDYYCLICLDAFHETIKPSEVYWASCCKSRVLLHISCLRQMALNAGYFTKCPGCNNQTDFIESIRNWGVFVPERDASWELDRNAFSDLLYVHDKCDVLSCICPDGRTFSDEKGKWKLILCKMCGSVGTHLACSKYKRRFLCDVCALNREENSTINSTNVCNYKNIQEIENDRNEEEFIEIEILEPRLGDFFVENENNSTFHSDCKNMVPLDNSIVEEEKEISCTQRHTNDDTEHKMQVSCEKNSLRQLSLSSALLPQQVRRRQKYLLRICLYQLQRLQCIEIARIPSSKHTSVQCYYHISNTEATHSTSGEGNSKGSRQETLCGYVTRHAARPAWRSIFC
ncbi:hypothetical protein RI129_001291 [Pyrocoelia pectoralis]|uniref:PHD-type domain-containing protein n=1 Tax=Pyrocoelia pectoralis TaxID=417401 RepID=A0AAN7VKH7_9COLE